MRTCAKCRRKFVDTQEMCPLDEDQQLEAPTPEKPPTGVGRVLGSYRLISLLGEGGMGNIYIGAHTRLNRYVAIKLLRPELQNRKDAIARFFEEARTVNRIKHPNIVESIDLVEDVVDGAYCVLELLHGLDLATRLSKGPLSLDSVIRVGAQIADALHAVHALDIVHRDLKPQNLILIARGGHDDFVKLIDFGVAQISEAKATGIPFGTAAYMAPEQAAGERVDGRADVYSLGVLLFEMVTGRHPFPSSSDNEYLVRHADDPAPRPSKSAPHGSCPKELDTVILRCLAKRPEERYASAAAVAVALRAIDVRARRGSGKVWAAVVLVLLAGGGAAAYFVVPDLLAKYGGERTEAPQADHVATTPPKPPRTPPQTPDPAPPDADLVTIKFASTPEGARVFRVGETVPLGTTPFETTFARSDKTNKMRFEAAGHEPLETDVPLTASDDVAVTLVKVPNKPLAVGQRKPPVVTEPKKKPGMYREGVIDPFAKN